MSRPKSITIAAILQFLWCGSMIVLSLPDLATGATPQAGGFSGYLVTVLSFTAAVLGLVAAYGTWMNTRGGKILAIVVNVLFGFLLLGAVLFASPPVKIVAGSLLAIPIFIIVLLLWRTSKPAQV
jgi:uncharacterized membrane protein (DUF2068 family)